MALTLTRRDIEDAHRFARSASDRAKSFKETGEYVVGTITQTVEVAAGAVGVGVLTGRFGPIKIAGSPIPLDLALGVTGHLLGFAGVAGKYSEHLHNFSDGVVAGWLTKWGFGMGQQWADKQGALRGQISGETARLHGGMPVPMAGYTPSFGADQTNRPLTESELASMAQAIR